MGKRDAFSPKETFDVVERLMKTEDIAATAALFYPKLRGADADGCCMLVWGGRRDVGKLRAAFATAKGGARKKPHPSS